MLTRAISATMALLAFAVVCFTGLLRGNSFASVMQGSLVALAVGAAVGLGLSLVVRIVVTENFRRECPEKDEHEDGEASGASDAGAARAGAEPLGATETEMESAAR